MVSSMEHLETRAADAGPLVIESYTEVQTAAPPAPEAGGSSGMLLGALGIVLALLAAVLVVLLRRRRTQKGGTAAVEPAPADLPAEKAPLPSTSEITAPPVKGSVRAAVHQHIGKREDQQDSYVCTDPAVYGARGVLAAVADGMGGLSNGRAVSQALVRCFEEGFLRADPTFGSADLLLQLAIRANAQVNGMLQGQERSGSTLVAAVIRGGLLHFLCVGDSRVYLYRGGGLIQLSREHIFQEELAVRALNREIPGSRVRADRQARALTSYFGIGHIPALDRNDAGIKLISGDKILLASDGVFGTLTDQTLEALMAMEPEAAAQAMAERIAAADKRYQDNHTAVILEYQE